jgi:hypothetical protein
MRKLVYLSIALGFIVAPASAQGTKQQKAACERDSHRLCSEAEPDAIAVEKCLKAHMSALSPGCRRQFKGRR